MTDACYLDHNATTPLRDAAKEAMACAIEVTGNASSVHRFGRDQRKIIEDARQQVANLADVSPANVIFTSGGSEANNTVLRGIATSTRITSTIEHASVLDADSAAIRIDVDGNGLFDLDALQATLGDLDAPALVSVMAANNETGVIQPIAKIAQIVREHDGRLHVDAIQWAGKLPLFELTVLADAVTISAHKLGGPQGVGAIIVRDGVPFEPIVKGGGQERRRRAGTENAIGIAGFGAACEAAALDQAHYAELVTFRDKIEADLGAQARVYGDKATRLNNTTCIGMPGVSAETQVMAFDLAGIAISAGSACSSGKVEPSHVLIAMGIDHDEAAEAVRVSLGWSSTMQDAERFIDVWQSLRSRTASEAA